MDPDDDVPMGGVLSLAPLFKLKLLTQSTRPRTFRLLLWQGSHKP